MWIEDYLRLQFPINPDEMQIEEAIQLKHRHIPNAVFRYRRFNEYSLKNLENQQERLSYPSEFNDPYDAAIKIDYDLLCKELFLRINMQTMVKKFQKIGVSFSEHEKEEILNSNDAFFTFALHIARFDNSLEGKEEEFARVTSVAQKEQIKNDIDLLRSSFQTGYLIMCVSEVKDSILMWSHYAENHTGFCIEYNYQELGPFNPQSRSLCPVIYTEELSLFDATQYIVQPLIRKDRSFNNLFGIYPAITKAKVWEYEKEWRVVLPVGPNATPEERFYGVPAPKALYIGAKASQENIEKLRGIAIKKKIPVYQMKLSENSTELIQTTLYQPNDQ